MLAYSDFKMENIGSEKTIVYIIMQDEKSTYHPLVSAFIKQCYEVLIGTAQEYKGRLPIRTNFVLDEFANLPPISDMSNMITAARSRNIRLNLIIQGAEQLSAQYGKETAEVIKGNCTNWFFLISKELQLLKDISELCGNTEVRTGFNEYREKPLISVSQLQRFEIGEILIRRDREQEEHPIASDKYGWELVLVNRDNYIPDDYEMDLMELSNGQKIDSRIYPYLQEMFDDARNAGVYPFVRDGYRTAEEQQQILDDKIAAYRSEGYTKHMAEETAMEWVALPGTSEHQLGLAVDINADTSKCSRDDVYNWLLENSYKYGFIQRYPSGKTSITGVANEPWHYRYVGKKAAEEIHQSGMCLEEYVENLK